MTKAIKKYGILSILFAFMAIPAVSQADNVNMRRVRRIAERLDNTTYHLYNQVEREVRRGRRAVRVMARFNNAAINFNSSVDTYRGRPGMSRDEFRALKQAHQEASRVVNRRNFSRRVMRTWNEADNLMQRLKNNFGRGGRGGRDGRGGRGGNGRIIGGIIGGIIGEIID